MARSPHKFTLSALRFMPHLAFCVAATAAATAAAAAPAKPSILYIVVDDLRPELPAYGQAQIHAPHTTALARRGLTFDRCYCQQPVCSPSRNSFMTGRRPDSTLAWNFENSFREVGPQWVSLPGHFLQHGYLTLGTGEWDAAADGFNHIQ